MFRRLFTLLAILSVAFIITPPAPAGAQTTTYYREGAHYWAWQGASPYVGDQQYIDFWAFADITNVPNQPPSRHSMMRLHLLGPGGATKGVLIAEDWIDVVGDPDRMSVSQDLGWAGIDTTVSLLDRNSGQMVRVEFHVYWWATGDEYHSDAISTARPARAEGRIKVGGPNGFTIQLPAYYPSSSDVLIFTHTL